METRQDLNVGIPAVVISRSPFQPVAAIFEDDGETGYFYATDHAVGIVDAMHIYNVSSVSDRDQPSTVAIVWSEDGQRAALKINGYVHAVFDFAEKRGYCRTDFPKSPDHAWSDSAVEGFFKTG